METVEKIENLEQLNVIRMQIILETSKIIQIVVSDTVVEINIVKKIHGIKILHLAVLRY